MNTEFSFKDAEVTRHFANTYSDNNVLTPQYYYRSNIYYKSMNKVLVEYQRRFEGK